MSSQQPLFVTSLVLNSHPHIKQTQIEIASQCSEKRNIIITGRNGCGKSTFLSLIKGYLAFFFKSNFQSNRSRRLNDYKRLKTHLENSDRSSVGYAKIQKNVVEALQDLTNVGGSLNLHFNLTLGQLKTQGNGKYVLAYFEAKRLTDLTKPTNITAPIANQQQIGDHNGGKQFLHHLVNRRSQLAFALEDNAEEEVQEIRDWFGKLDELFSRLFEKKVKLKFLRSQLDFILEADDGETIDLKYLSDGYSAIVNMVTEIIMRMEAITFGGLNVSGIVLIDEVETHLHVALQREILPFLTTMFPNIQFIVTTHSPFVLQSVDDALIYDLESNQGIDQAEELWKYSYEALVDGYFEVDKFSGILRDKIIKYKELSSSEELERAGKKELRELRRELESVPTFKNAEIETELKQLGLK